VLNTRLNYGLILTIALPLFAIVASVGTAVVAFSRGDPPLPDQYHWEGDKLDHDFAQSRRASELHLNATIDLEPARGASGVCHLTLTLDGDTLPLEVDLALIHVSNPALDRHVRFVRTANTSTYFARCTPLPPARWHVELSDPQRSWSFRSATTGLHPSAVTVSSSSPADE
jgi:hypothetical protein